MSHVTSLRAKVRQESCGGVLHLARPASALPLCPGRTFVESLYAGH